jgi:hypothetical protein
VSAIASYGLAIVGVVLMLIAILPAFTTSLNYPTARLQLINLLRTSPNRAEMMCKSMKGTFGEAIAMAMKTVAMTKSRDPAIIVQAMWPGYDAVAVNVGAAYKQILGKVKLAAMAVGGGLVLALSSNTFPVFHILAVLIAGGAFVLVMVRKNDAENAVVLARRDLLPEVQNAFVEGRYIFPPGP